MDGKGQSEPESRALPDFALDAHFAAHELHQLLRNRQAQARTTVLTGRGSIGLRKAFEDVAQLAGRNADAGVRDRKAKAGLLAGPLFAFHADVNVSLGRELDGVAGKVDENLPDAARIADNARRRIG